MKTYNNLQSVSYPTVMVHTNNNVDLKSTPVFIIELDNGSTIIAKSKSRFKKLCNEYKERIINKISYNF